MSNNQNQQESTKKEFKRKRRENRQMLLNLFLYYLRYKKRLLSGVLYGDCYRLLNKTGFLLTSYQILVLTVVVSAGLIESVKFLKIQKQGEYGLVFIAKTHILKAILCTQSRTLDIELINKNTGKGKNFKNVVFSDVPEVLREINKPIIHFNLRIG